MHLLLTDQLTCPRCGPDAGLILLAERVEARRVYDGQLGCARCRQHYDVREGVADLRTEPANDVTGSLAMEAEKLAALLGVTEGPAMLLLLGEDESIASALSEMLPDVEVIVAHSAVAPAEERTGVSRLRIGQLVPLQDSGMRGVAVANGAAVEPVREAARVCGLAARLVVQGISDEVRALLPQIGMHVLAEDASVLVAARHG